jgi:hypothetical protein
MNRQIVLEYYDLFENIYSTVIYNSAGGFLRKKSAEEWTNRKTRVQPVNQ